MEAERDLFARQLAEKLRAYRRNAERRGSAMASLMEAVQARTGVVIEGYRADSDLAHLDRVNGLAQQLRFEEGGDALILVAGSYVHDYRGMLERRREALESDVTVEVINELIAETLAAVDFPAELVSQVCDCIEFAGRDSFSEDAFHTASVEARILHDANNLDALGAIGVARAFMFGGAIGEPIWLQYTNVSAEGELVPSTSIVHHFHEKLLRLKDGMLTEAGRTLAETRHDFMVIFLDALEGERGLTVGESYPPA